MNILHIYKAALPKSMGGVEQVIHQLSSGTAESGANVEVLALNNGLKRTINCGNYKVHYEPTLFEIASTPFSFRVFYTFRKLVNKADIIHYHYPYPFADMLHFTCCPNKPSIVTYHSDIIRQKNLLKIYTPLQNKFLSSVDHIVSTSPNYFKTSEILQDIEHKVSIIPLGLDESTYPAAYQAHLNYWKQRFGDKFFLFVGVLRYYKGLHILLDALKNSDYTTVILGSGPVESALKEKANELGLKNLHFLGSVSDEDKVALLELCYGVVFPSHMRSEAFGLSLVEASMFAKPMISCEIGTGTSYINIHDQTGFVAPPGDTALFSKYMSFLWDNSDQAKQMGNNARQRYLELFTGNMMVKKYLDLYNSML